MSDKTELLPCPFCKSAVRVETNTLLPDNLHDANVVCDNCEAQGPCADAWYQVSEDAVENATAKWNAALAQQPAPVAVPDGWKLVPLTPEGGMLDNATRCVVTVGDGADYVGRDEAAEIYRTMLAAAPAAPVAVGQEPPLTWGAYVNGDLITGSRNYVQRERDEYETTCLDDPDFVHEEAFPLYAAPPAAEQPYSTTSDKYRAELYDEVWEKARDMGYGNVTNALVELERMKAAEQPDAVKVSEPLGDKLREALQIGVSELDEVLAECRNWGHPRFIDRIDRMRALLAGGDKP